ncbi:transcriptional regulator [Bacteroidia bacterium]|nr:transcriptional regulator [Bacteroidia bacterium]
MGEKEVIRKKRVRRPNSEIDQNIAAAMKKLVARKGFSNLTLSAVAQQSKVDPPVLYNKFGDLNGLLKLFTENYELWPSKIIDGHIQKFQDGKHEEFLCEVLSDITQELYKDKIIKQLLIWELADTNEINRNTAKMRESNVYMFSRVYKNLFNETDVDAPVFVAIIVAGIYYLVLHKDVSTFCSVDFSSEEGKKALLKTIEKLCSILFAELAPNKQLLKVAAKLKKKGVDINTIAECTGLPLELIK